MTKAIRLKLNSLSIEDLQYHLVRCEKKMKTFPYWKERYLWVKEILDEKQFNK